MSGIRPLNERRVEQFYLGFFVLHIFTTLIMDCAPVFYQHFPIPLLKQLNEFYIDTFKDPIMSIVSHTPGNQAYTSLSWFRSFLWCELIFQVPVFFYGVNCILQDQFISKFGILGIIYSSHVITTVLPVLSTLFAADLDFQAKLILFGFYVPFLIIPAHLLFYLVSNVKLNNSGKVKNQ